MALSKLQIRDRNEFITRTREAALRKGVHTLTLREGGITFMELKAALGKGVECKTDGVTVTVAKVQTPEPEPAPAE